MIFIAHPLGIGTDYLNHLARAYIEFSIDGSQALQRYYEIHYSFVPDYTIELFVPPLAHIAGIYGAGSLVVAMAVLIAPLGGIAVSRALHGGQGGWLPLLGFMTLFNRNLEFGFINFLFAFGLALFCFALWIKMRPGWRRSLIVAILAAFVAANHILGFLFLGYIVLLWEGARFAFEGTKERRALGIEFFTKTAFAFLPGLVLIGYAFVIAEDVSTYTGETGLFAQRGFALLSGLSFYNSGFAVFATALAAVSLLLGFYFGLRAGAIAIRREMRVVCIGVFILVLIMPTLIAGIWGLHLRYGGALVVLVAASVYFPSTARWPKAAAVFAAIAMVLLANGITNLARVNNALQSIRAGVAELPDGARVIGAISPDVGFDVGVHAASLAVIEADAYVPNLFTNISAVGVRSPYRPQHFPQGKPQPVQVLRDSAGLSLPPAQNSRWSGHYYFGWPRHFTHVLYARTPGEEDVDLPYTRAIASGPDFVLYEITYQPE